MIKWIKVILLFSFIVANANDLNVDKRAVDELNKYTLKLPDDIYDPFIVSVVNTQPKDKKIVKKEEQVVNNANPTEYKEKKVDLLAVLNHRALLKIEGLNIKKWLKVGDKIDEYVLKKIINSNSVLVKIRNKVKMITMNNNLNIKVKQ